MIDHFCFLLYFSKLLEDTYTGDKTAAPCMYIVRCMIALSCFLLHFSELFEDTYAYDKTTASYINAFLYDRSLLFSLIF